MDQQVELFALLALAAVAHVASIFKAGATWEPAYLFLTVVAFALPIFTLGGGMLYTKRQAKKEMAHLVDLVLKGGQYASTSVKEAGQNEADRDATRGSPAMSCCMCRKKRKGTVVQQEEKAGVDAITTDDDIDVTSALAPSPVGRVDDAITEEVEDAEMVALFMSETAEL